MEEKVKAQEQLAELYPQRIENVFNRRRNKNGRKQMQND